MEWVKVHNENNKYLVLLLPLALLTTAFERYDRSSEVAFRPLGNSDSKILTLRNDDCIATATA